MVPINMKNTYNTMQGIDPAQNGVKVPAFEVSVQITRPANTTVYTAGQIINSAAAILPALDFSSIASPGQAIQITGALLTSNNGSAATKLNAQVHLFNVSNMQPNCADQQALAPTYAMVTAARVGILDDLSNIVSVGGNAYSVMQSEIARIAVLDSLACLYPAIVTANAYTPASGEILTLKIKGFLL